MQYSTVIRLGFKSKMGLFSDLEAHRQRLRNNVLAWDFKLILMKIAFSNLSHWPYSRTSIEVNLYSTILGWVQIKLSVC